MAYKYPFITGEDLKAAASQINLNFDIDNIQSSMALAADDLKDVISEDVWDRMIEYFNGGSYDSDGGSLDDELVNHFLAPMANLTLYHHFIWLQINIDNSGVTVVKSDTLTSAFKYQTDEAKDKLLQTGWIEANTLISFLNDNEDEITEWKDSDQKTELAKVIFTSYKDFEKYFSIDKNAAFYIRIRYIILELIAEEINSRIEDPYAIEDAVLLIKVKRFLAYKTMALALFRFDILNLPQSIRQMLVNTMSNKSVIDDRLIKDKIADGFSTKAELYLRELDLYQASKTEVTDTVNPYEDYEHNIDEDNKFASML